MYKNRNKNNKKNLKLIKKWYLLKMIFLSKMKTKWLKLLIKIKTETIKKIIKWKPFNKNYIDI